MWNQAIEDTVAPVIYSQTGSVYISYVILWQDSTIWLNTWVTFSSLNVVNKESSRTKIKYIHKIIAYFDLLIILFLIYFQYQ